MECFRTFNSKVDHQDTGLLDVEECVQDTHKLLMRNLLERSKCGWFSTEIRISTGGHLFPKFNATEEVFVEVQRIIDQYNSTINFIKESNLDSIKRCSMYIRCAAWLLYNFVSLHPFSDGNGRMCRLLASNCLYLVFPFPCPIYNISAPTERDDYLRALKEADGQNGDVRSLVALLIESGWFIAKDLAGEKIN